MLNWTPGFFFANCCGAVLLVGRGGYGGRAGRGGVRCRSPGTHCRAAWPKGRRGGLEVEVAPLEEAVVEHVPGVGGLLRRAVRHSPPGPAVLHPDGGQWRAGQWEGGWDWERVVLMKGGVISSRQSW